MDCQCKGPTKNRAGCVTQTSPMEFEGLGYHPPNRFIISPPTLTPQPSCAKPCHNARWPGDDHPTHGFSLRFTPTTCPPTLASKERGSSPHTQTCDPPTHIPLGTIKPCMQDTGCSSQGTSTSISQGHHCMCEPVKSIRCANMVAMATVCITLALCNTEIHYIDFKIYGIGLVFLL